MDTATLGIWSAAIMTLFLYSYIFVDNPFFKFAEHAYIGVAAAYGMVLQIDNMIRPTIKTKLLVQGQWILIIPIILGLMIYTRYFKSINYIARYTVAFMVGVGAGVVLARDFRASFMLQVADTMRSVTGPGGVENLIVMVGVVTTLTYFFFTLEQKGFVGVTAKIGRWTMMIALGAAFGNTVMARVSLFLGRVQFLLGDWLGIL